MKTLNDLNLKRNDKKKVEEWLTEWLDLFIDKAGARVGSVYRADFENLDLFYFTDCTDILSKEVEGRGVETNLKIRTRKRFVFLQLFVRTLLGKNLGKKLLCSHCGYDDKFINGVGDGTGHYEYCPKCGLTYFVTYVGAYQTFVEEVRKDLIERGFIIVRDVIR